MYCVYMSTEYLEDEPATELYGQFIDENYDWRPSEPADLPTDDEIPSFLNETCESDVDLLTGDGSPN